MSISSWTSHAFLRSIYWQIIIYTYYTSTHINTQKGAHMRDKFTLCGKVISIHSDGEIFVDSKSTGIFRWKSNSTRYSNRYGAEIQELRGCSLESVLRIKGYIWSREMHPGWCALRGHPLIPHICGVFFFIDFSDFFSILSSYLFFYVYQHSLYPGTRTAPSTGCYRHQNHPQYCPFFLKNSQLWGTSPSANRINPPRTSPPYMDDPCW